MVLDRRGVSGQEERFRPALPTVLLLATIPLAFGILMVTSLGSAALSVMFAFGLLGRRIARAESTGRKRPGKPNAG